MDVTEEELRTWARDLYQSISEPEAATFSARLVRTINAQPNEVLRQVLAAVHGVVLLGYPLSWALALNPTIFPEKFVAIVRYGEIYGELDATLRRYAERPDDLTPRCRLRPPQP